MAQSWLGNSSELLMIFPPSIVYIDEIDAVGTKRYDAHSGGDREVQRTMLQLLNQLDGFDSRAEVILATNKIESLDPALLRPGRIDRKIEFPLPAIKTRRRISQIHTAKMTLTEDVNLEEFVMTKDEFSGADIKAICTEGHKNIVRLLKNKPFRKPDISVTIQGVLERIKAELGEKIGDGVVIDVGANVGMASFAAAVMGFRVLAFEPILENLQRICDRIYFNKVGELVTVFEAAASDHLGNITVHKLVGRLDNSAVSAAGAKLAFKSNEEVAVQLKSIPLDEVVPETEPVYLIKIDVQGWEHHVLKGASKLLSRKPGDAPYLIYEEDERLLQASNSSAKEIHTFLESVGYNHCERVGTDAHCTKKA